MSITFTSLGGTRPLYLVEADGETVGIVGKTETATRSYWYALDADHKRIDHPRFDADGYEIDRTRKRVTKALIDNKEGSR